MSETIDPGVLNGKLAPPERHAEVVVVGAGPCGLAAATRLAGAGLDVLLVDENPLDPQLIGLDVPLFFGGRASAAVQNPARMLEQIFSSDPAIEAAFDAGVAVELGVTCWGLYRPGEASRALPAPVVALANTERSWTVSFDRLVIASGARDLVMFFDGADQPGVMGALAFERLVTRYDAFDGQRVAVFGSSDLAADMAELALDRGLKVVALVEPAESPLCSAARVNSLAARGVAIHCEAVIKSATRGPFGISSLSVVPRTGGPFEIECDTLCLALGRVPSIELFEGAGLAVELDGRKGGFVPVSNDGVSTSSPLVFGTGECMGLEETPFGPDAAVAEGVRAADAVLASLGRGGAVPGARLTVSGGDQIARRKFVMQRLMDVGGMKPLACQCEEVTREDVAALRAPRYLGAPTEKSLKRDLNSLLADGPPNHDQMKRLTRISMGACQARRCREQIALIMSIVTGRPVATIPLAGYRPPARPLPLSVLATIAETEDMVENWPVWFTIPTQWVPYDIIGTDAEATMLNDHMHL